jgi:hypothetical protein
MQRVVRAARALSFTLILCLMTNCAAQGMPLDEVETLLYRQSSDGLTTVRFECSKGEAGWNYICQARYEPASSRSRTKPRVQRVAVKQMGTYRGSPAFSIAPLPDEGPVLTADQLAAYREAQAAEASQRAQKKMRRKSR